MGYYIGINGLVFKLPFVADAVREAPLGRIVLETDSPYLTPLSVVASGEGGAGTHERNEPVNVKYVAQKISEIKNISFKDIEKQTTENAQKVFGTSFK